jgi:hypothetical protein
MSRYSGANYSREPRSLNDHGSLNMVAPSLRAVDQGFDLAESPIEYTENISQTIENLVFREKSFPAHMRTVPTDLPINIRSSIRKMHLLIDAYHTCHEDLFVIEDFIHKSIGGGFEFTSWLKKFRLEVFVKFFHGEFLFQREKETKRYRDLKDISQVPPYQYLINWKEPDSKDIEYSLIPTKINNRNKMSYKRAARDLVSEISESEVRAISEEEIFFTANDSKCLVGDPVTGSSELKWKERSNLSSYRYDDTPLKGRRCLIQVGPGNLRDGVLLTIQQSNSVRIIEKQVWEIVKQVPGSAMTNSNSKLKASLKRFFDDSFYYLSRDFKKEGWTKPLELLNLLLDVLEQKFPSFPAWKHRGIFSDHISVYDKENKHLYETKRGHGIGFANALTTLHSLTVYILTMQRVDYSVFNQDVNHALAWNDDFVARFPSEEAAIEYYNTEGEVFSDLSLIRKDEACFYGMGFFHFLENYYARGRFNNKKVYKTFLVYQAMLCHNIVLAKAYVCSISSMIEKPILDRVLPEVIRSFGYEFFPEEINLSYQLGGWRSAVILGIDTSIFQVDLMDPKIQASYYANRVKVKMPVKTNKKEYNKHYISPFEIKYPEYVIQADDFIKDNFHLGKTVHQMNSVMTKFTRTNTVTKNYFTRLAIKRREEYLKYYIDAKPPEDFIKDYVSNTILDVYPPEEFRTLIPVTGLNGRLDHRIYRSEDPIHEYFSSIRGEEFKSKYPLYLQLREIVGNQSQLRFIDELEIALDAFSIAENREELYSCDLYEAVEKEINLNDYYISPANVCKIAFAESLYSIPVLCFNIEREILKEKAKIFGRMLSPKEEESLSIMKVINRTTIISLFKINENISLALDEIKMEQEDNNFALQIQKQEAEIKYFTDSYEINESLFTPLIMEEKVIEKKTLTVKSIYKRLKRKRKLPKSVKPARVIAAKELFNPSGRIIYTDPYTLGQVESTVEAFQELDPLVEFLTNGFRVLTERPESPDDSEKFDDEDALEQSKPVLYPDEDEEFP